MQSTQTNFQNICLILGDQLNQDSEIFEYYQSGSSLILMAEIESESVAQTAVSSKQRTCLFLSAMRHFHQSLKEKKYQTQYYLISDQIKTLSQALTLMSINHVFKQLICVLPGDERVRKELSDWCKNHDVQLNLLPDRHFIAKPGEFKDWAKNKTKLRMEYWYRYLRKSRQILMDKKGNPIGGKWNYDSENRKPFSKTGPKLKFSSPDFNHLQDPIVKKVIKDIDTFLPTLPGQLEAFSWPISREQALEQLHFFIEKQLPMFGDHQDAMWINEPFLFHSLLASSLNLKLLQPLEVIKLAEKAYLDNKAPLNAVEGFIRQILGWREFVRGIYWLKKSEWKNMNFFHADHPLPDFFWDGQTDMQCLSQSISQVLRYGYGHHIQRLMITGLFNLLNQTDPQQVEQWYLAMYVDAVAWVEQPNTLAMSQFADGGFLASKPYIASGNYIHKMSNYCQSCRYSPKTTIGDKACPFTTLYWRFIDLHQTYLSQNPRLTMQVKHWLNKPEKEREEILFQATKFHQSLSSKHIVDFE